MNITRRGLMISMGAIAAVTTPAITMASQIVPPVEPVSHTALERANVRQLVSLIRTHMDTFLHSYLFDENTEETRNNITKYLTEYFDRYLDASVLNDYVVVCDTTNNTQERIDRNELWVDAAFKVTGTEEFIHIPARLAKREV